MVELIAKSVYSVILIAVAALCVVEVLQVWRDRALQYGQFVGTKDGQDAASAADSFRRLVVQQQAVLVGLYEPTDTKPGGFKVPDLSISPHEIGRIPQSLLDNLKIETGGVNVTSLLTTLRRWIAAPNEVTGSLDQIGNQFFVSAEWNAAPRRDGRGTRELTIALLAQPDIQAASFQLACRVIFEQIAAKLKRLENVTAEDFCSFSQALLRFRKYLSERDRAATETERKTAAEDLTAARLRIDALIASQTRLIYAYKLGAYIDIEDANAPGADAAATKKSLDSAQRRLTEYGTRLAAIEPDAKDPDVQERLLYLARRSGGTQVAATQVAANVAASVNLGSFLKAVEPILSATTQTRAVLPAVAPLKPGASIGAEGNKTGAGTLCCFVADENGKKYFITADYVLGSIGSKAISPALIDAATDHKTIGTVVEVADGIALVALAADAVANNGDIKELAPNPQAGEPVHLTGRTSARSNGMLVAVQASGLEVGTPGSAVRLDSVMRASLVSLTGDGGAPVLDLHERLIGLVYGASQTETVILPLKPIFERRRLRLL